MLPKIAKSHTFAILRLTVYLGCRLFSIFRTLASSLSLSLIIYKRSEVKFDDLQIEVIIKIQPITTQKIGKKII
jgi:hypothetical protein